MMYTVLVVEDESLELQALVKLLGAYSTRIKSVFQAQDSSEALELARLNAPDIILMDINIPGRSGLDVLETLHAEGYSGEVVIITAYSRFEYAQIALRVNVVDYLLKPIDSDELYACLRKVFEKLDARQSEQHRISRLQSQMRNINAYMQPIALGALFNAEAAENTMRSLFDWPKDGELQAFALRFYLDESLDEDEQKCFYLDFYSLCQSRFSLIASVGPKEMLFAVCSEQSLEPTQLELSLWCICARMLHFSQKRGQNCRVRGSGVHTRYEDFAGFLAKYPPDPRAEALDLPMKAICGQLNSFSRDMRTRYSKALMRLKAGTPERIPPVFKPLLSQWETRWAGLFCVLEVLRAADPCVDILDAYQAVEQSDRSPAMAIVSWIEQHELRQEAAQPESSNGFIIEQALDIIENEYGNPMLSQADIAENIGLSPAYFSRLFKKEVGKTFISHLTNTRMEHAKALLRAGAPISEIAEACGYQSRKYFMDAFRQNTGMSVAQYMDEVSKP